MKIWVKTIVLLSFICSVSAADIMQLDNSEIARQETWLIFNGNMELGEPGKPVPGFCIVGYFNRDKDYGNPEKIYAPVIRREESGNQYLEMPGYRELPEYNLYPAAFFLQRDGEVEVSFMAKSIPDEDGKLHEQPGIIMDFRCSDLSRQYGSVNERYPVLASRTFNPGKEWLKYSYRIPVKGNFTYTMMFRSFSKNTAECLNGLCVDELKVRYLDAGESICDEASISCDRTLNVFYPGEEIELKIQALLHAADTTIPIRLHIRSDYFLKNSETIEATLNKTVSYKSRDARSLYTGSVKYRPKQYGSFNTLVMFNSKPVSSYGGDFAVLHKLDKNISPLRKKIGGHFRTIGNYYQLTPSNECPVIIRQGTNLEAQLYSLCGFGHAMVSFDLKKVQPEPDRMDFSIIDADIKLLEKYGIEPVPSLGAWWNYTNRKTNGKEQISPMPNWFYNDKFTRRSLEKATPDREPRTLNDDVWRLHVSSSVEYFGSRVSKWMLLVEPQWVLTPQDYLTLQKIAWEIIKKKNPQDLLIAGDATSDAGYNLSGWLEKLHNLEFEKYLDCVSFNPYESSLDNINGVLFRYSNLIEKIRKILTVGTPLWEQELYYISNSKRKQDIGRQDVFSAGDVQRHYLLGLLNGLRGITGIPSSSIGKNQFELGPNDVLAGLNSLSSFLDGKSEVIPLKLSNKLLRCGIFTDGSEQNCSGVIWSLRSNGISLTVPTDPGVRLYDCYGNELELRKEMGLGLDPIFATGSKDKLTALFTKSEFTTAQPIALRCRTFGNMTFLEAENLSGSKNIVPVDFEGKIPPVQFYFNDSDYLRLDLDGKLVETGFKAGIGESKMQGADIALKPNSSEFTIPDNEKAAIHLTMTDGSKLEIWINSGKLWIRAEVEDPVLTPSPDNNLYNGDAVELFIDRTPFRRIDIDEFGGKNISDLKITQYIFAAVPSLTGSSIQIINPSSGEQIESAAVLEQEKTQGGYALLISLPLEEITPVPGSRGIVGMNFELSKKDGNQSKPKAALIAPNIQSYKFRSHYPLFEMKELNVDLLRSSGNKIKWKSPLDSALKKTTAYEVKDSFGTGPGIKIDIFEEPSWGPALRRGSVTGQPINISAGDYLLVFQAKGGKIDHMKVKIAEEKEKIFNGGELPVNERWVKYEIPFTLAKDSTAASVYLEFLTSRQEYGSATVSDISLFEINRPIVKNKGQR
jgi:hypothetical protein